MITALNSENDKVSGLETGADDYVTKPFGVMELVSRIKALLRRSNGEDTGNKLLIGGLALYPESYIAECNGVRIDLTLKEFELLAFLLRNPNVAFTREVLLDNVWVYEYEGGSHTVEVHIQTLRSKLGGCSNMIKTVRGVGYRFGEALDD
jgi:two-component system alkaline phosphatase synthesis response regulator PhoP